MAEIVRRKECLLIVDAAVQLPPVSNLWTFCVRGADLVIFSGGKSLMGPQTSSLIVGKKAYMERDHEKEYAAWSAMADRMVEMLAVGRYRPRRVETGSVGQTYPRVFIELSDGLSAGDVQKKMYRKRIFVGADVKANQIYLSPQNLTEEECDAVIRALLEVERMGKSGEGVS